MTAYCPSCERTVYLADREALHCPVCASRLEGGHEYMPEAAADRIVKNESLFREINELVAHGEQWPHAADKVGFVCECGQETCTAMVYLTRDQYENMRSSPVTFFTLPGHEVPGVEVVRERRENYQTVEKLGPPRKVAERRFPRSGS